MDKVWRPASRVACVPLFPVLPWGYCIREGRGLGQKSELQRDVLTMWVGRWGLGAASKPELPPRGSQQRWVLDMLEVRGIGAPLIAPSFFRTNQSIHPSPVLLHPWPPRCPTTRCPLLPHPQHSKSAPFPRPAPHLTIGFIQNSTRL